MATAEKKKDKSKKRIVKVEAVGQAHVRATFNNIIIAMTNSTGQVITWSSAGKMGFKGSVEVFVKGPGSGRESAIRTIQTTGIEITTIRDMTPLPHNGCRPPKARRV
jgi:small subunit ribosomal protein S11